MSKTRTDSDAHILKARALEAARVPEDRDAVDAIEVVTFRLGVAVYAVEAIWAAEVFRLANLTKIPGSPEGIAGVARLRGELLTLIDLPEVLGLPPQGLAETNQVVVLTDPESGRVGLIVDAVLGVRKIPRSDLHRDLLGTPSARQDLLLGVTHQGIAVLRGQRLLDPELSNPGSTRDATTTEERR